MENMGVRIKGSQANSYREDPRSKAVREKRLVPQLTQDKMQHHQQREAGPGPENGAEFGAAW